MELNREIRRCHRCTFSICRLLPSPSPLLFLFIHQSLLIPSIHSMDGSAEDYLHLLSCLPGFLLVVRPAGGSFFGGSPYGPVEWGGGEREREKRVEYEQNDRKKLRQPLYLLHQPRLADLKLISDISKQRGSQREGRATRSGFNKGCPPFHSHYRRAHIDRASARRVGALFHLFEWETKERPFVVLARVNLHKAITACNL